MLIKLIINWISWYSYSTYDYVSRLKIYSARSLMNLKMYVKSHKKYYYEDLVMIIRLWLDKILMIDKLIIKVIFN